MTDNINYFNPRSREGSDSFYLPFAVVVGISIHAPARGATLAILITRILPQFQSTLPRGERQDYCQNCGRFEAISIHAPARGATLLTGFLLLSSRFQSTLPRGERRDCAAAHRTDRNFNPRSREGSDRHRPDASLPSSYFNPRSREGSD